MDYLKFHKRSDFFFSYDNQVLLGVISQFDLPFWTPQERTSFPLQFGQEDKSLLIYFENFQDVPYSHEYEEDDEYFYNS